MKKAVSDYSTNYKKYILLYKVQQRSQITREGRIKVKTMNKPNKNKCKFIYCLIKQINYVDKFMCV